MYRRFGPFILLGLLVMAVAGGTVLALSRGEPPAAPTASPGSSVPSIVNVQGRLTDSQRNPIDGSVQVTFRIYTGDTAGTPIWYETQSVTAQNGLCNVLLGSNVPLTSEVFSAGPERWMAIKLGDDPEMASRLRIGSVPYALVANQRHDLVCTGCVGTSDLAAENVGPAKLDCNPQLLLFLGGGFPENA